MPRRRKLGRPRIANPRTVRRELRLLPEEAAAHDAARGDRPWSDWTRAELAQAIARGSAR